VPCRLVYSSRAGVAKHPSAEPCHHHEDHERDRRDGEVTVVAVRPLQLCCYAETGDEVNSSEIIKGDRYSQ